MKLGRKELAYRALCTSEFAWNMEDEDDETAVMESAQMAISYLRQLGIPYTNRSWSDIVEDAAKLYCEIKDGHRYV
jgi:hypothetical protein